MSRVAIRSGAVIALVAGASACVHAQAVVPHGVMPELRADVLLGRQSAMQVAAGAQIPVGYYVRMGLDAAVGRRYNDSAPGSKVDARLDLLTRFLLDPFRQSPYGLSVGAGLGVRAEPGDHVRPVLLAVLDVEGRRWSNGWVPALAVGLGGGARVGLVLRKGIATAR